MIGLVKTVRLYKCDTGIQAYIKVLKNQNQEYTQVCEKQFQPSLISIYFKTYKVLYNDVNQIPMPFDNLDCSDLEEVNN